MARDPDSWNRGYITGGAMMVALQAVGTPAWVGAVGVAAAIVGHLIGRHFFGRDR